MILAVVLVGPFRGSGIAFALSFASAVNTVLLLVFLKRNPNIAVNRALGSALLYMVKLSLFSAIAVIPLHFLSPRLLQLFAGRGRIISYGAPFTINALIFATIGILLLFVTKDRLLQALVRRLGRSS
jgi:putative peptidoglycan lipid II flippase